MGLWRRHGNGERGAAMVEFAILLPLFLLVIGGIVDLGRAFFTQIQLANAAREGARAAVVSTADPALIEARAKRAFSGATDPADWPPELNISVDVTACPGDVAEVTASYAFSWLVLDPALNLFGGDLADPFPLSSTAVMKCGG